MSSTKEGENIVIIEIKNDKMILINGKGDLYIINQELLNNPLVYLNDKIVNK